MAQISAAGQAPIPSAKKDDSEDVAWALSTAEAMYARGDHTDALKWLRRAAESASEAQADDRALELAKAAADLATLVQPSPSVPPPPPLRASQAPPPRSAPPQPTPATPGSPLPPPVAASSAVRPSPPLRPATPPLQSPPQAPPPQPTALGGQAPRGLVGQQPAAPPSAPRGTHHVHHASESRRVGRRSRPDIDIARPTDEPTQTRQDLSLKLAQPKRRGRASRPVDEELTPLSSPVQPNPDQTSPFDGMRTAEIDAWPTQHNVDELADPPDEKTRIGVPAYEASAKMATEVQSTPMLEEEQPQINAAQAIRVVVWRTPDGLRIAPHGTDVAAIKVDAMLVALDPDADLVSWLTGK